MKWEKEKRLALLEKSIDQGVVDEDIIPVLLLLNGLEDVYTLSSCSGRVGLLELPELGDKKGSLFFGKWHQPPGLPEVQEAVERWEVKARPGTMLFLLTVTPILHVNIKTRELAGKLYTLARNCGFKHSSFKSLESPYLLEILSTERVDIPVGFQGRLLVKKEDLEILVELSNRALGRAKRKLLRLEGELRTGVMTQVPGRKGALNKF